MVISFGFCSTTADLRHAAFSIRCHIFEGCFKDSFTGSFKGSSQGSFKGSFKGSFEEFVKASFKGSFQGSFKGCFEARLRVCLKPSSLESCYSLPQGGEVATIPNQKPLKGGVATIQTGPAIQTVKPDRPNMVAAANHRNPKGNGSKEPGTNRRTATESPEAKSGRLGD